MDLQFSILQYRDQAADRHSILATQELNIGKQLDEIKAERAQHARAVSKLIGCEDETDQILMTELKNAVGQLQHEQVQCEEALKRAAGQRTVLEAQGSFTWSRLIQRLPDVMQLIQAHDPKLLKGLLATAFRKIVVEPLNEAGEYPIKFYVVDPDDDESSEPPVVCGNSNLVDSNSRKTNSASSINLKIKSSICTTPLYANEAFLKQKYVVEKVSARQISVLIGCAHSTVLDALRRFGVTPFDASKGGHIPYGFKLKLGKIVPHVREKKTISQILLWRNRGWSHDRIANRLNERKVAPPGKGQRWSDGTVRKILLRNQKSKTVL